MGKAVHHSNKYSLFTVPASALILFSPTVAPASPWRVPREVKEFMAAPAVELAVDAATERKKKQSKINAIKFVYLITELLTTTHRSTTGLLAGRKKDNGTNKTNLVQDMNSVIVHGKC